MTTAPHDKPAFPGLGSDPRSVRQRVEALEELMESAIVIPGLNRRVGLDAIIGLIPILGDVAAAAIGSYVLWEARNLGMSRWQLTRIAGNVGFDWLIGLVPGVGDAADFFFRSNSRNLKIIKRHLDKHHPGTRTIDGEVVNRDPLP
jgi:hypothetical protein